MYRLPLFRSLRSIAPLLIAAALAFLLTACDDDPVSAPGDDDSDPEDPDVSVTASVSIDPEMPEVGDEVTLDGSASSVEGADNLTFEWNLITPDGSDAEIDDPTAETVTFEADVAEDYTVELEVSAERAGETSIDTASETLEVIDLLGLAEAIHAETDAPGVVIGAATPDARYIHGVGAVGPNRNETPTEDTIFQIASISKVLTGIALADMVAEGTVALDQPASELLPDSLSAFGADGEFVTLEHLATHTSGLPRLPDNLNPDDDSNLYADYEEEDLMTFIESVELETTPGDAFQYSNVGSGLLGHLLEQADARAYGDLVSERVAGPLDMDDLYRDPSDVPVDRLAMGVDSSGDPLPPWEFDVLAGAAAFLASITDLLNLGEAAVDPSQTPIEEALNKAQDVRFVLEEDVAWGLGWSIFEVDGRTLLWHDGATYSYGSGLLVDPERGYVAAVLVNGTPINNSWDPLSLAAPILEELSSDEDGAALTIDDQDLPSSEIVP